MAPLFAGLARMRDGEEHRTLKAALQRALASCDDTLIQQTAAQCAARLAPKAAEAAAITRFNYGLPVCTLGALLGVPEAQWQHLIDDSRTLSAVSPRRHAAAAGTRHCGGTAALCPAGDGNGVLRRPRCGRSATPGLCRPMRSACCFRPVRRRRAGSDWRICWHGRTVKWTPRWIGCGR